MLSLTKEAKACILKGYNLHTNFSIYIGMSETVQKQLNWKKNSVDSKYGFKLIFEFCVLEISPKNLSAGM